MPKLNHLNIGEVVNTIYLEGVIKKVYSEDDTCDVIVKEKDCLKIPIFYHCEKDSELRDNGAIYGAASAFKVDDKVIVLVQYLKDNVITVQRVLGFEAGLKPCECTQCEIVGAIPISPYRKLDLALNGADITWVWQGADSYPNPYPGATVTYNTDEKFILMSLPAGTYSPFSFGFEFLPFSSHLGDTIYACCIDYEHELNFTSLGGSLLGDTGSIEFSALHSGYFLHSYEYNTFYRAQNFIAGVEVTTPYHNCGPTKVKRMICVLDETQHDPGEDVRWHTFRFSGNSSNWSNPGISFSKDSWIKIKGISVYVATPDSLISDFYRGIKPGSMLGERNCYCDEV